MGYTVACLELHAATFGLNTSGKTPGRNREITVAACLLPGRCSSCRWSSEKV